MHQLLAKPPVLKSDTMSCFLGTLTAVAVHTEAVFLTAIRPPPQCSEAEHSAPPRPPRRNRLTLFQCPQRPNPKLSGHSQVERGLHLYAAHKYIFIIFWKFVLFGEYAVNPWPERMPQVRPSGTRKRAAAAARVPRICLH